ncbi:DnaJ domain-containing protein [Scleroderma yunnanense]
MVKQSTLTEAYALLGLDRGATLDQVRSAYKQLALRLHPDKNQGNAEATTQFQQLAEAYGVLQKHIQTASHSYSDDDFDDYYSDFDSDYDDCNHFFYDDDYEEAERMAFFMYFFEEVLRGRSGRGYGRYANSNRGYQAPESPTERAARMQRQREQQAWGEQRRAEEAQHRAQQKAERKAFETRMREKEHKEAEERQRAKAASKKAEAESQRRQAAETAQAQQQRAQTLRSAAFAAARAGDAKLVKKSVWEDSVDSTGGEVQTGCEKFVKKQPEDPRETLLHIAAQKGDVDLVEWLNAHSADPEERNSVGLSAFHVALQHGHIPILKHFFEAYDPKYEDHSAIYSLPPPNSLLSIALESGEPEVVWTILDKGFATTQDISNAWTRITSMKDREALLVGTGKNAGKFSEIQNLLMSFGGFTPPPTPPVTGQDRERSNSPTTKEDPSTSDASPQRGSFRGRGRRGHGHSSSGVFNPQGQNDQPYAPPHGRATPSDQSQYHSGRGKQRGRGQGRGRGRGRGRGN